jgi:hypothetical protein
MYAVSGEMYDTVMRERAESGTWAIVQFRPLFVE